MPHRPEPRVAPRLDGAGDPDAPEPDSDRTGRGKVNAGGLVRFGIDSSHAVTACRYPNRVLVCRHPGLGKRGTRIVKPRNDISCRWFDTRNGRQAAQEPDSLCAEGNCPCVNFLLRHVWITK